MSTDISFASSRLGLDTTGALLMKKVLSPLSSHTVAGALASKLFALQQTRERQALTAPPRQNPRRYGRARNACPSLSIRHLCATPLGASRRTTHPHDRAQS